MTEKQSIDRYFQAMADPCRRGFIERLSMGPASVTQLAAPTNVQLPAVLKHLRVLEKGGIVVSEKVGRVRTYRIRSDAFNAMTNWIEQRQHDMNAAFDNLAVVMAQVPEKKDH